MFDEFWNLIVSSGLPTRQHFSHAIERVQARFYPLFPSLRHLEYKKIQIALSFQLKGSPIKIEVSTYSHV